MGQKSVAVYIYSPTCWPLGPSPYEFWPCRRRSSPLAPYQFRLNTLASVLRALRLPPARVTFSVAASSSRRCVLLAAVTAAVVVLCAGLCWVSLLVLRCAPQVSCCAHCGSPSRVCRRVHIRLFSAQYSSVSIWLASVLQGGAFLGVVRVLVRCCRCSCIGLWRVFVRVRMLVESMVRHSSWRASL